MPFHGRPSDACEPCRKGRLRCDRIRPSCTQCIRKTIICSGYRNVSLLLFKDESESTARKVQWEKNGEVYLPPLPRQTHDHEPVAVTIFNKAELMPSPACSLTPSHDELALGYFMSSYVPASPFYYLPEIYNPTAPIAQHAVSSTVLAASLASLSLHVGSSQLMNNARMHYSKALAQTNAALASPNTAILDSSLISVLTLGLYEATAFSSRRSPASWTTHTLGAVQLIRLRGTKQLKTALGTRLFLQTCNNIRSSCIQRSTPLPNEFLHFCEQAKPFLDPNMPNVRLGPLLDKLISLKVQLREELGPQRIPGLIHETLQLDEEAQILMDMLPASWRYQVMPLDKTPTWAYQGIAHTYTDHRMARHWNILRATRLFANEVVWHLAAHVARAKQQPEMTLHFKDIDAGALSTTALTNRIQIITDILASAPHFLDENGTSFGPAARFMIWPLTIVAERKLTPEPIRRHAIWCLYEIARQARIPQALQAAEAVESGASTDWMHLFQLG